MSSVDDYSLTPSQQHDNRGEINNSPVEIKLSAHIAAFLFCSVLRFSCSRSSFPSLLPPLVEFLSLLFSPSSLIRGENLPKGSLSFLPSLLLSSSHLPHQFCQVSPKGVLQLADSLQETITSLEENFIACSNCLFSDLFSEPNQLCFRKFGLNILLSHCCRSSSFFYTVLASCFMLVLLDQKLKYLQRQTFVRYLCLELQTN